METVKIRLKEDIEIFGKKFYAVVVCNKNLHFYCGSGCRYHRQNTD